MKLGLDSWCKPVKTKTEKGIKGGQDTKKQGKSTITTTRRYGEASKQEGGLQKRTLRLLGH